MSSNSLDDDTISKYLYTTYRVLWEHASEKEIIKEVKILDKKFLNKLRSFSWKKALIHKDEKEKLSI